MSRKDYRLIAQVLREQGADSTMVLAFCNALNRDNPNFDRVKFYEACFDD